MKILYGWVILVCLFSFSFCTRNTSQVTLTGHIGNDLNSLLPEGQFEVMVMDSVIQSPREMELSYRMQQALERNKKWYQSYIDSFHESRVLPYHPNFGLSATEYNELMQMKLNISLSASSTNLVNVKKTNGIIQFSSDGKLPYLDALLLNTNDNLVFLEGHALPFSDTIFVANENHGLKSQWKGYNWSYTEPDENDTLADGLNTLHYSVTVGQLYKNGNTLLVISKRVTEDGELKIKMDKPLVFVKH